MQAYNEGFNACWGRIQIVMTILILQIVEVGHIPVLVDTACRLINNNPQPTTLLGHTLGLGIGGQLAQGYCALDRQYSFTISGECINLSSSFQFREIIYSVHKFYHHSGTVSLYT